MALRLILFIAAFTLGTATLEVRFDVLCPHYREIYPPQKVMITDVSWCIIHTTMVLTKMFGIYNMPAHISTTSPRA